MNVVDCRKTLEVQRYSNKTIDNYSHFIKKTERYFKIPVPALSEMDVHTLFINLFMGGYIQIHSKATSN